jgi:hypothetical protein
MIFVVNNHFAGPGIVIVLVDHHPGPGPKVRVMMVVVYRVVRLVVSGMKSAMCTAGMVVQRIVVVAYASYQSTPGIDPNLHEEIIAV